MAASEAQLAALHRGMVKSREAGAARNAAFIEDVEWMVETGESTEDVVRRMGITKGGVQRRLQRCGRPELWDALRRNEIIRFGETLHERTVRETIHAKTTYGMGVVA